MGKRGKQIKNKTKKLTYFHLVVAIILIYSIATFIKQEIVMRNLVVRDKITSNELKELKEDIVDLEEKLDKSETVQYIEKISREELNMIKPHEIIYRDKNKRESSTISD